MSMVKVLYRIKIRGAFGPPIGGIPPIFKKLDKKMTGKQKIGDMAIQNWRKGREGSAQRAVVFAKDKNKKHGMYEK